MYRYYRLAALVLLAATSWPRLLPAQTTPTAPAAKNSRQQQPESTSIPVSPWTRTLQARQVLKRHVDRNEIDRITPLLAYQRQLPADSLLALRSYEEWALLALVGDFYELTSRVRKPTSYSPEQQRALAQLPDDGLFEATAARAFTLEQQLRETARHARFLPEDSAFVLLYLSLLTADANQTPPARVEQMVQSFLRTYPDTEYHYLLRYFTAPEYTPSRFSYGLDFHSGTGVLFGQLPTYFRHGANFGHGFEFGWDQYRLYLRNYIGVGSTRQDFGYEGAWGQGMKLNYLVPEVSVGYQLYEGKVLRFTPFVGMSAFLISPADTRKDSPGYGLEMNFSNPFTAGVNLDFKFANTQSSSFGMQEAGHWMIKLRGGVRAGKARHADAFRGGIIYLDLGIGGFGRRLKPKTP